MTKPTRQKPEDPSFATTIAHGLSILEAFDVSHPLLTNKAIAERTGLSSATVSRLTTTLQGRDMLVFDAMTRGYRLASGALTIGYPLLALLRRRREMLGEMKRFAEAIDSTVSLGMRDRDRIVFIESAWGSNASTPRTDLGAALPMLQSAVGRAWLAVAPEPSRAEVIAGIRSAAPEVHARWGAALARAMAEFREHGFCTSFGDWRPDVFAVAVPLQGLLNGEMLVVSCGVPSQRFDRLALSRDLGPRLRELARRVEAVAGPGSGAPGAPAPLRPNFVQAEAPYAHTLARGIDVLTCFSSAEPLLGHAQLARRLGLGGPTVARLTHTLLKLGYLRRVEPRGQYAVGAAALALAYPMLSGMRLRALARPFMRALAERIGGAVSLGIQHRESMVYVQTEWNEDDRVTPPDTGTLLPILGSAMGRAWLCHAGAAERTAMLNRIRIHQPESYARIAPKLDAALRDFRARGYASSWREFRDDVVAFAVPLAKPVDSTSFVLNCGLLATGRTLAEAEKMAAPLLVETVRRIEAEIGLRDADLGVPV